MICPTGQWMERERDRKCWEVTPMVFQGIESVLRLRAKPDIVSWKVA